MSSAIERFALSVSPATLDDLRARLALTRFPLGIVDSGGIPLDEIRELGRYWSHEFDWPSREKQLNEWDHFRAVIDGQRIHFIHQRSSAGNALPLLLLHGWPGSFMEMLEALPLLASFHVVVPSLPGFGFSDPPCTKGMSNRRIAELMAQLMNVLGYGRFAVQGGDWGAGIATWLALNFRSRIAGLHLNYIPGSYSPSLDGPASPEEETFFRDRAEWNENSGAYGHVQRTRPLTLGYALADSPIGLLAWIVEKFREWSDPRSSISRDALLTNVTLYWATNTIASSMRLYHESSQTPLKLSPGQRVNVPCAVARFPFEAPFPPRAWIDRGYDVVRWTEMPRGGHFAAMEEPELFAKDVGEFLKEESVSSGSCTE